MDIEILNEDRLRHWCEVIDVQAEAVEELARVAARVREDEALLTVFTALYERIVVRGEWFSDEASLLQDPAIQADLGQSTSLFYLLGYLAHLPKTAEQYQRRGIGMDIFHDTLLDIRIWLGQAYQTHGYWCFEQLPWIQLHLQGRLFRLGRLQFMLATFESGVKAFRSPSTGEVILLGDPELLLRADGYALGVGKKRVNEPPQPEEGCWQAEYTESADGWRGNPISPLGYALPDAIFLPKSEWELILQHGDQVLDLHIPRGERMGVEDCRDSFRRAFAFFAQHAPDQPFKASVCHTWFFTPQLQKILPAESNIVRFQREFYLYPYPGGPGFLWDYAFGPRYPDPASAPRDTSLRRAALDWLDQGGEFFDLPGVMFHGPDEWGTQPYMRRWESSGFEQLTKK